MSQYNFIASDYELPLLDFRKAKYYKFKENVKVDIDEDGKIYYYTNDSNKNSPDLLIPCGAEEADTIMCESEEDLRDLTISNGYRNSNVDFYTSKNFVYTLNFCYSDKRALELIDYLKEILKEDCEVEIWSIWLESYEDAVRHYVNIESLSIEDLKKVFDIVRFENPKCIVISNNKIY